MSGFLKRSRYLKHIDDEKIFKLAGISRHNTLSQGNVLLRQDEPNQSVYIIVKGSVSVFIDREFVYTLGRSGDILGEMSVITGGPSNATIAADKEVEVIEIPAATLKEIHGNAGHELHSALYHWFSSILTDKLHKISQKAKQFETINRRLQSDLTDAKMTQDRIFSSHTVKIPTFPMTLKCEFSNILGGDLYAVFPIGNGAYGILIGDVSGHGTGACLISMMILNLFIAFSKGNRSSSKVLSEINDMALQFMHQGKFATLFYGIYDENTCGLTYTNAGHHPALILARDNITALPATSGIPIGILQDKHETYEEGYYEFEAGERLILFTDAVFEDHPETEHDMGGLAGLAAFIKERCDKPSCDLVNAVYQRRINSLPRGLTDDFTMMVFDQE